MRLRQHWAVCRPLGAVAKLYLGSSALIAGPNSIIGCAASHMAFEMRLELRHRARVADHNEVVVLRILAACTEVSCAGPQSLPVDRVGLQVHERPAALDPHVVRQVAELDEVVPFARIEDNPDNDAAVVSLVLTQSSSTRSLGSARRSRGRFRSRRSC